MILDIRTRKRITEFDRRCRSPLPLRAIGQKIQRRLDGISKPVFQVFVSESIRMMDPYFAGMMDENGA
jgi:hypothetical protein